MYVCFYVFMRINQEFYKRMVDDDLRGDVKALAAFEMLHEVSSAVHSFRIISGKTLLTLSGHGVDIFEFIPKPQSIVTVRDSIQSARKKNSKLSAMDDI
jgi:hypothetical protein